MRGKSLLGYSTWWRDLKGEILSLIPSPHHRRHPWTGGRRSARDMCRGLSCAPLSPPKRGGLGRGGGESEASEGPGTCGGAVPLEASPWHLLPLLRGEVPPVLLPQRPRHHLQPHPAAAAAGRQRHVQLSAAAGGQSRQHQQSGETSVFCVCARWVTAGLAASAPLMRHRRTT